MSEALKKAVHEIVMHVGEERLASEYDLTSMEIPGDMLRRLAHASAETRVGARQAGPLLHDAIYALNLARVGNGHGPGGRELALAITNAEQAEMWLHKAECAQDDAGVGGTSETSPSGVAATNAEV